MRVVVLDDHPTVRAGLRTLLAREADLHLAGAAVEERQLWRLIEERRPAVVVLDHHHPGRGGIQLCLQIKSTLNPPAVVVYSALTPPEMVVAACVAGADAIKNKSSSAATLINSIRLAATHDLRIEVSPPARRAAAAHIDAADHAILSMRLSGVACDEIAGVLRTTNGQIERRIAAMIGALEAAAPPSCAREPRHSGSRRSS